MHVNYSAPHSQNRLFEASFLLMWLLRHIELDIFLRMQAFDACQQNCATLNSLHVEAASTHKFPAQGIIGKTFTGHTQEILQEF